MKTKPVTFWAIFCPGYSKTNPVNLLVVATATEGSLLICKQCLLFTFATDLFPCRNKGYLLPYKNGQQKLAEFFYLFCNQ